MTDHPHDILAEYVDGSLSPDDRAGVDAHLSTCATCREEARLAGQGRDALRSLPEAEPPDGLGLPAIREARAGRGKGLPTWATWTAAAAALVVVGMVAFASFGLDGPREPASPVAEEAPGAPEDAAEDEDPVEAEGGPLAAAQAPTYRTSETDHDAASLQGLARDLRNDVRGALEAGFAPTAEAFYEGFRATALSDPATEALTCVTEAFSPDRSVVPFLVERSSFDGDPAVVAAFLQGPSPTVEYDRILIIVADEESCSLQSYASQRL